MTSGAVARRGWLRCQGVVKILRRRRNLVIVTVVLITALTPLMTLSLAPRYGTVASVLIEQGRSNIVDRQATGEAVGQEATDSSTLVAEIDLLRSRTFAQKVVEDRGPLADPDSNRALQQDTGRLAILLGRLSTIANWVPQS